MRSSKSELQCFQIHMVNFGEILSSFSMNKTLMYLGG